MTQPAVSARIKALEESLGVALFERGQGGLGLSAAGRALRPHAEQLLRAVALARQKGSSDWTLNHGLFRRAGLVPGERYNWCLDPAGYPQIR